MPARNNRKVAAPGSDSSDLPGLIAAFSPYLQIAHQIPGRIRLKVALAVLDDPAIREIGSDSLAQVLGVVPGVRDIRINKLARSCTVDYQAEVIPDSAWHDLLSGHDSPAARILLRIIEDKYQEIRHGQLR